jgi:nicotinate phosphoribosyltransferase
MVHFKDRDVRKLSPGKMTLAGEKQVFRKSDPNGRYLEDIIGLRDDIINQSRPLLKIVMENGKMLQPHPSLQTIRDRFKKNFALLDDRYKSIFEHNAYPVTLSNSLQKLQERT